MATTRNPVGVLLGILALVMFVSCSDSKTNSTTVDAPETTVAETAVPDTAAEVLTFGEVVSDAMTTHGAALGQVGVIDQDPISPDFTRLQSERAVDAIDPLLAQLPEDASGLTGPGAEEYDALRTTLVGWRDFSSDLIAEIDGDYEALVELAASWDGNQPPLIFTDAMDGHMVTWIPAVEQSCAALAVAADVAPGCLFGPQGGPADTGEAELQVVMLDGVTFELDPIHPVSDISGEPGFFIIDYGPGFGIFALLDPPAVADPTLAGPRLDAPIPWPSDVGEWLASLPVEVVSATEEQIGEATWHIWHVRADEQVAIIERSIHPPWTLGASEVHIYQTTLGEAPVVAVLEVSNLDTERTNQNRDDIAAVLASIVVS